VLLLAVAEGATVVVRRWVAARSGHGRFADWNLPGWSRKFKQEAALADDPT
jgi:hypothetical protein